MKYSSRAGLVVCPYILHMRLTRRERLTLYARVKAPWRLYRPDREVRRRVQGVDVVVPWSHRLPDYARTRPQYGQNLVRLASALSVGPDPLLVLDVGANVGDSALQIMAATDARVLCVEGDRYWADYLTKNVGNDPRAVLEIALLTESADDWTASVPIRAGGTTRFVQQDGGARAAGSLSVAQLRAKHPDFDRLRLVKSDTDGFDPVLVPAVAATWQHAGPVLFFEFDPALATQVDDRDPYGMWSRLLDLGYTRLALWDNLGDPLGQLDVEDAGVLQTEFSRTVDERGYHFVDVAACRADDVAARSAFDDLTPGEFTPLVARRTVRT